MFYLPVYKNDIYKILDKYIESKNSTRLFTSISNFKERKRKAPKLDDLHPLITSHIINKEKIFISGKILRKPMLENLMSNSLDSH